MRSARKVKGLLGVVNETEKNLNAKFLSFPFAITNIIVFLIFPSFSLPQKKKKTRMLRNLKTLRLGQFSKSNPDRNLFKRLQLRSEEPFNFEFHIND